MAEVLGEPGRAIGVPRHTRWVRISHWLLTASILTLAFTGFVILMAHPRLYWGDAGNDLTPALLELPISRNYKHGGWTTPTSFYQDAAGPITASRTFDIFNENGWGRSLHFLAAWCLVLPGACVPAGRSSRGDISGRGSCPGGTELSLHLVWRDVVDHLRFRIPPADTYSSIRVPAEVLVLRCRLCCGAAHSITGLTMSPAVTSAFPILLRVFGGYQSARTIHFASFIALLLFAIVHVVMVVKSGFRHQIRAMTVGD